MKTTDFFCIIEELKMVNFLKICTETSFLLSDVYSSSHNVSLD